MRESGQWRSLLLAALVHILLLSFLWVGIRWQNKATTAVEAEVWDMTTREAAPLPVPVEAPPAVIQEAPPLKLEQPKEDPEIALAQEKKRKLAEQKKEQEHLLAEQKRKLEQEQTRQKLAEQQRKAEQLAAEQAKKLAAEQARKLAEQKKQVSKEQLARDKVFQENMRRLEGQAGVTGSGGSGTAARSTGNNRGDPSYGAKIAAKVRSNTIFNVFESGGANPTVIYRIELLPDGSLRGAIRKLQSSGVPGFDEAVAKGIEKSAPFPRDKSGEVPPSLELVYKMKEE